MNEKQGNAYHLLVFKEKRDKGEENLFLDKRHGEREMEKLKAMAHHLRQECIPSSC